MFFYAVTFGQVVAQYAGGPLAETHTAWGFNSIADRDNDVEVVVPSFVLLAVIGSSQRILDFCSFEASVLI